MKRSIETSIMLAGLLALLAAGDTRAQPDDPAAPTVEKVSVVLFDLECEDIERTALRILTDVMRSELVKSDRFALIDRAHVQKVLEEQQFQLAETVDEATMVEMGQLIGAEKIVTGRIGWLGRIRVITLQLIGVSTGRVEQLEATDFVGEVEHMRRPVRAATQRLIGIGGFLDLGGGFVHIISRPVGAAVYVDGLYEGISPLEFQVDSAASYLVRVSAPGHQDWSRYVYVEEGETTFLEPALISLTPSDIHMESIPAGANVYVYGRFQGTTPVDVRVDSAGMYEIQMTRDDFHDWEERVHVRISEDLSVQATLVPNEVIEVVTSPVGATVYFEGGLVGSAPVLIPVDSPGDYRVTVEKDDYQMWERTITVRSGEQPTVNASLNPIVIESRYVRTGAGALWTFMLPYSVGAGEALIYSLGVRSSRPYVGAVLVGGPMAYFGMLRYTAQRDISSARASMIISSGMWGTAWGIMSAVAVRPDDNNKSGGLRGREPRIAAGLAVAASAAAIAVSSHYTERVDLSRRRVALINAGGFLGSVMGVGVPYLFDASNSSLYFGSLMVGGVSGLLYTVYATRGMDRANDDGGVEPEPETSIGTPANRWSFAQPYVSMSPSLRGSEPKQSDVRYGLTLLRYRF